ncbi:MAG: family 10 glycosylhydrolase [Planctomycetes bacterium]|nr:family 10 glycosylhydrolase [Planctomycetota bacterium]
MQSADMTTCITLLAISLVLAAEAAVGSDVPVLENASFERLEPGGLPSDWQLARGDPAAVRVLGADAPQGAICVSLRSQGKELHLRQKLAVDGLKPVVIGGFFQADGIQADDASYLRLYIHVLYKDRPYEEHSRYFVNLPAGTWGRRRFQVQVQPKPGLEPSELWVTIATRFAKGELRADGLSIVALESYRDSNRWVRAREAIRIDDMSRVQPAAALSDVRTRSKWKVLDYASEESVGKCIAALPNTHAPEVTLPLDRKGWYAVYVGLGGVGRFAFGQENCVRLKLSGDRAFVPRGYSAGHDDVDEVFFKVADLTGKNLHIAQWRFEEFADYRQAPVSRPCVVMYVKLVPLTDQEAAGVRQDVSRRDTKRLIATFDGFSWVYENFPTTEEEFLEYFEAFRDTDFGTWYWQVSGADLVNYRSQFGTIAGERADDFPRKGDEYYTRSVQALVAKEIDFTKLAVQAARDMGVKIHIAIRPAAWQAPPQFEDYFASDFYRAHPEWRCYDRDGTPVMRMSFAVPEVRRHLIDIMREAVTRYRPDGIEIIYFRGLPLILWEDAFCESFDNRFGADATSVPEDDPRLMDLRCEMLTSFMTEIRAMLDETQKSQNRTKRYALSASVVHTRDDNRRHGIDVERWVKEGLVDQIGIFPWAFHTSRRPVDWEWFSEITKDTGVELYPVMIGWKQNSAQGTLGRALEHYGKGASGILVWDPNPVGFYSKEAEYSAAHAGSYFSPRETYWPVVSRLGHLEEMRHRLDEGRPVPTHIPLRRYGDYWFGRWIPDVGF